MYLRRWGLATLSFDRYKIAQTLLRKSCILSFETVLGMNEISSTPTLKNLKIPKINLFVCDDIF